jgi:ABC-2 type transport system ATP-binding protein
MADEVIATGNIGKRYGKVRAVDGVSLGVKKGELYGFLGLNGAGKTTTIRMLLAMVKPDAGAVNAIMEQLRLTPYRDRKARKLSLGNVQRLGLAKALIHRPRILILDEPSNGLDPAGMTDAA